MQKLPSRIREGRSGLAANRAITEAGRVFIGRRAGEVFRHVREIFRKAQRMPFGNVDQTRDKRGLAIRSCYLFAAIADRYRAVHIAVRRRLRAVEEPVDVCGVPVRIGAARLCRQHTGYRADLIGNQTAVADLVRMARFWVHPVAECTASISAAHKGAA